MRTILNALRDRATARHNMEKRISALEDAVFLQTTPEDWAAHQADVTALVRALRKLRKLIHAQGWFKEAAAEADVALQPFGHIGDVD